MVTPEQVDRVIAHAESLYSPEGPSSEANLNVFGQFVTQASRC